ncbi:MAG: EAL domain-containing protein [Sulfuricurvum sp.]|nr:EAL domain-containing protein [Sulfuricurvum sp.]
MNKIRIRATLYAMGIVLILIAFFVYSIFQDKKRVLDEKISSHRELLKNAFDLSISDTEKGLNHFAYEMMTDSNIVDAFESGNRERLYSLALPYFNKAHKRGEVDLTGFIDSDGTHFLRLLDPQKFGDNITKKRPILAEAIRTRQPILSLDVTLYNISLVQIVPIFKNKKFLGLLQVSASIDRVQERLNSHSGIKSALAIHTETLNKLLPAQYLKHYSSHSIVSYNDLLFQHLPDTYDFAYSIRHEINGHTYVIASRELLTYADKPLAKMICALDITEDEVAYKNEINRIALISIILLILLAGILHIGFKTLIARINRKSSQLNNQLHHQLYYDSLTALPNRKALIKKLYSQHYHAVILLNIDNFKEMNDLYGHEIGDKILQTLGKSIEKIITLYPLALYKMHSDEYALALMEKMEEEDFDVMCQNIMHQLHNIHYDVDGITVLISLSMGADICSDEECDMISRADMALKTAKKKGFSFVKYHDNLLIKEQYHNNILWSKKLKDAIDDQRFELYYQGIHHAASKEIYEYEALIRIIDEEGLIITPSVFLDIAKKSRLYSHITHFVINRIFQQLKATHHHYSINLSVDDILNLETQNILFELLAEYAVGDRLVFEILESEGIENYEEVSAFIARAKEFGCKIAIDDFGTGYSNFAHILRLNVDFIKIDGSLIKNITTDIGAQDIVKTIVEFSHRLGILTVAEFVSTQEIYTLCQELGIDYLQGYYLSEPRPL